MPPGHVARRGGADGKDLGTLRHPDARGRGRQATALQVQHRAVETLERPPPPRAGRPPGRGGGEPIVVGQRPQVAWRWTWGIRPEQRPYRPRAVEEPVAEGEEPRLVAIAAQRREPHLP